MHAGGVRNLFAANGLRRNIIHRPGRGPRVKMQDESKIRIQPPRHRSHQGRQRIGFHPYQPIVFLGALVVQSPRLGRMKNPVADEAYLRRGRRKGGGRREEVSDAPVQVLLVIQWILMFMLFAQQSVCQTEAARGALKGLWGLNICSGIGHRARPAQKRDRSNA